MNDQAENDETVNYTIEILGKPYSVRCRASESASLQSAAAYLNQRMQEVKDSGKAINLERIAIMTALNMTHQFLQVDEQKNIFVGEITQRIVHLQDKLDLGMNLKRPAELIYTTE